MIPLIYNFFKKVLYDEAYASQYFKVIGYGIAWLIYSGYIPIPIGNGMGNYIGGPLIAFVTSFIKNGEKNNPQVQDLINQLNDLKKLVGGK